MTVKFRDRSLPTVNHRTRCARWFLLLVRPLLFAAMLCNTAAASLPAQTVAVAEGETVAAAVPDFALFLGSAVPLKLVSYCIEKYHPLTDNADGGQKKEEPRPSAGDTVALVPAADSGSGAKCVSSVPASLAPCAARKAVQCAPASGLRRLRTDAVFRPALAYLVVLSLKNLPDGASASVNGNYTPDERPGLKQPGLFYWRIPC